MLSEQQQRIMGYFIEEAKDHLNTIEQGLLNLQATIADPEMVSEVFRAAHSVKGGAAMLGLDSIQQTAHRLEDYFKLLKECPVKVDQKLETLSLRVFDTLQELLEQLQGPFGLTEDKANEVMANVEPVFTQLNQYLSDLVSQSGGRPPEDVELPQPIRVAPILPPVNREESALRLVFQSDVPARLREMLQLFKQIDQPSSRQQLQEVCQALARMGEQFDIPTWGELLEMARRATANPDNTYRTLAPVLIKDIKQAHELVLAGRSPEIDASHDLKALVPAVPDSLTDTDFGDLLAISDLADADTPDLFDFSAFGADDSETDTEDNWFTDASTDAPIITPTEATSRLELGFDQSDQTNSLADQALGFDYPLSKASAHPDGPEVGIAELNSLADLFEQEVPDLDMTWQEESIVSDWALPLDQAGDNFESLELDSSNDFSDLLFDQDPLGAIEADDDLSGLLNRSESASIDGLGQPAPAEGSSSIENLSDLLSSDFFEGTDNEEIDDEGTDSLDSIDFSELTFTDAVPAPPSELSPDNSSTGEQNSKSGNANDLGNLDELFDSLEFDMEEDELSATIDSNPTPDSLSSLLEADLNESDDLLSIDFSPEAETSQPEAISLESADDLSNASFNWATPAENETDDFLTNEFLADGLPGDLPDGLPDAFLQDDSVSPPAVNSAPWATERDGSVLDEAFTDSDASRMPAGDEQDVMGDLWDEADQVGESSLGEIAEADLFDADSFAVVETATAETPLPSESIEAAMLPFDLPATLDGEAEATDLNDFDLLQDATQPLQPGDSSDDLEWLMMEPIEDNEAIDLPAQEQLNDNAVTSGITPTDQYLEELRLFGDALGETPDEALPAGAIDSDFDVDLGDLFSEESETPEDWSSFTESQPQNESNVASGDLFSEEADTGFDLAAQPQINPSDVDLGDLFGEDADTGADLAAQIPVDESDIDLDDLFGEDGEAADTGFDLAAVQLPMDESEVDLGDLFGEDADTGTELGFDIEDVLAQVEPELFAELSPAIDGFDEDGFDEDLSDLFAPETDQEFFETAESIAAPEVISSAAVPSDALNLDISPAASAFDSPSSSIAASDLDELADPATALDFSLDLSVPDETSAVITNQTTDDLDEDLSWLMASDADSSGVAADDAQPDRLTGQTEFDAAMLDFDSIDLTNAANGLDDLDSLDFGSFALDANEGFEEADVFSLESASIAFIPDLAGEDDPDDLFGEDALFASDASDAANDADSLTPAEPQSLDDLDYFLDQSAAEVEPADGTELGDLDLWGGGSVPEPIAPSSDEFDDLDALLDSVAETADPRTALTDEFDDLDALLADNEASEVTASASEAAGDEFANEFGNEFDDLDALLNVVPPAEAPTLSANFDDFADLEALLDDEMPISSISGFNESDEEDFADLEALLGGNAASGVSSPPQESPGEFDDLEKLLEDADQTLGGSATNRGVRRPSLTPKKRSLGVLNDQTMRVSVKNLDNLNNLVGELVVNRNSLEQTQERLRQFLDNLLYQVQQLSDVGQRMRDLYERSLLESSLLSSRRSYQLSPPGNGAMPAQGNHSTGMSFDALEMDRFTGFHTLSQEMIELIVRVRESASDIDFVVDESDQVTRMFRQVTTQLQEGLTRSRMVPFDQTAARLPRAVRDISVKCGKQAELAVEGKDTLIDKMILEQLYDPMTHLVNNAITHGIETPAERQASGKPPMGRITIRAFHQGNQTVISVTDDGAGIDPDKVKRKAIEKRLISASEARNMTRLDVYDLLFQHGFSTRDKADDFAGRGVGMDVVRTSLNEIRGSVNIDSTVGRGTTFTIRLPLTLSISKALCCISNRARIAFPMDGVEDMLDVPKEQIHTDAEGRACIQWRDSLLPFQPLSALLKYSRSLGRGSVYGGNQEDDVISVVVLRSNAGSFIALQVDQVLGEQEIVIKQLEGPVPKPIGVAGATVLGDGHIMPIADVLELIDLSFGRIRRETGSSLWEKEDQIPVEPQVAKTDPTVLIVDDSITVRELLSMTFNKIGYRVEQARDGQEAWEKLRAGLPCDLVFCDIEMPRMDGLELLSRIQKDANLKHLPIAMLTSRGADRHRQMAVQLGAKGYFTKPYLEEALLDAAQRMLKGEVLVG